MDKLLFMVSVDKFLAPPIEKQPVDARRQILGV